jgi:transposase
MNIKQRWIVIYSNAASHRAIKTITRQVERAKDKTQNELFHLQAQRFSCKTDAQCSINKIRKKLKYHQISDTLFIEHKVYHSKGRPKKGEEAKCIEWQAITQVIEQKSCFILATNTNTNTNVKALSPEEVFKHYKAQSVLERGFRFLKYYLSSILYPLSSILYSLYLRYLSRIQAE